MWKGQGYKLEELEPRSYGRAWEIWRSKSKGREEGGDHFLRLVAYLTLAFLGLTVGLAVIVWLYGGWPLLTASPFGGVK